MEVSALRYTGGIGLHGRSPLLRLQSDERLISLIRRGHAAAFEVLVSRYQSRLLAFCRHLLGSREDAEDVLQEALAAAFNAILADDRPINVRPWLYRIARNRCLNHLRRIQAVGVDSMDVHLSEHGVTTADKVHKLEEFWMLVGDIQELPETQKTALVLREMDALSYEQIAEAMETTVPSVKSLLVRARVSLAEAAEARMLSCEEVRMELAEAAEGLRKKTSPVVRRHLRSCERCSVFRVQLKETSKALTAVLPIGPLVVLKKLVFAHLGHSAGASAGAGSGAAGQAAAVGSTAAAGTALVGSGAGSIISFGAGTIVTKAAAGLAAAALVTAGAVEVSHDSHAHAAPAAPAAVPTAVPALSRTGASRYRAVRVMHTAYVPAARAATHKPKPVAKHPAAKPAAIKTTPTTVRASAKAASKKAGAAKKASAKKAAPVTPPGRTETQTQTTVLASGQTSSTGSPGAVGYDQAAASSSSPSSTTSQPSSGTTSGTGTTGSSSSGSGSSGSSGASSDGGGSTTTTTTTSTTSTSPTSTPSSTGGVLPDPATAYPATTPSPTQ